MLTHWVQMFPGDRTPESGDSRGRRHIPSRPDQWQFMQDIELPGVRPRLPPGKQQAAVRRILMHAGITIPIRDVELPRPRIEGHMGTAMKGIPAHKRRGLPRHTQGEEHFALQRALADRVIPIVGTKYRGIGPHGNAMGPRKHAFTPGARNCPWRSKTIMGCAPRLKA